MHTESAPNLTVILLELDDRLEIFNCLKREYYVIEKPRSEIWWWDLNAATNVASPELGLDGGSSRMPCRFEVEDYFQIREEEGWNGEKRSTRKTRIQIGNKVTLGLTMG
jgi:hypothetical protein